MSNPNKVRGTTFETDLVKFFRARGLDAERLTLQGSQDQGDLVVRIGERRFIFEAKNRKQIDLAGWISEAVSEALNYGAVRDMERPHFAVIHKRKQKGVDHAYVTLPLYEYLEQING